MLHSKLEAHLIGYPYSAVDIAEGVFSKVSTHFCERPVITSSLFIKYMLLPPPHYMVASIIQETSCLGIFTLSATYKQSLREMTHRVVSISCTITCLSFVHHGRVNTYSMYMYLYMYKTITSLWLSDHIHLSNW